MARQDPKGPKAGAGAGSGSPAEATGADEGSGRVPSFEEALARVEAIVERLEEGDLTLDESLKLFQEGIELSRRCQTVLDEAQRRIEQLVRAADGSLRTEPLAGIEKDES